MTELDWTRPELWPWLLLAPFVWLALWRLLAGMHRRVRRWGGGVAGRSPAPAASATRWTTALVLLLLCAMDPLLGEETVPVERRGLDVVFCLDTSRSMLARDIAPDRLARAKRDVRSVLPELVGGDRVGLVAFAGEAKLIVPLTHDLNSFEFLLDTVDIAAVRRGGTDLAAALRKALALVEEGHEATSVCVLLTDGEDLTGAGRQAAAELATRGVQLHCVGYGSTRGSKITLDEDGAEHFLTSDRGEEVVSALDADGLRRMAAVTGGEFVRADVMALPLVELKRKRMDPVVARSYESGEESVKKTRFQWVLLPAILVLLFELWSRGGRP